MVDTFRAELQALVKAYDEHGGRWPDSDVQALFDAVTRARTLLAEPEPCGYPSCVDDSPDESCSRWLTGECQGPDSRTLLAEPEPELADTHYEWELQDADGDWQAGGSANSLNDVRCEGTRYLQTYAQDGPRKLIIRQHTTQAIDEMTNG